MSTFDELNKVAKSHDLQVRTQTLDDGRLGVMVTFSDDPSAVCGLACAVLSANDLDEAAEVLLPAVTATLNPEMPRDQVAGDVSAATCDGCGGAVFYAGPATAVDDVRCPACAGNDRLITGLETSLALSLVQSRLDDVASRAARDTSLELVPILAELARLRADLVPSTAD